MMKKQGEKQANRTWSANPRKYIEKELINILVEEISQFNRSANVK